MGKAAFALLLVAGGCTNNDNVVYGSIGASTITPFISFENVNSVISGRARMKSRAMVRSSGATLRSG